MFESAYYAPTMPESVYYAPELLLRSKLCHHNISKLSSGVEIRGAVFRNVVCPAHHDHIKSVQNALPKTLVV